jgi:hypothetical protein
MTENFKDRLERIASEIELGMNCTLKVGQDEQYLDADGQGRFYLQVECLRPDAFTGVVEKGWGGKAYLTEYASNNEIVQIAFGLYKGYWEHEARETFKWRERRVFGPHIDTAALWEVARRVDLRSAQHEDDKAK